MINHQLHADEGILEIRPVSPLTSGDFEGVACDLDPWLEKHGPLTGLKIQAEAFPGWDNFAGMLSHFRFVRDHHKLIRRVAIVSDSTVLTIAPKIADHFVAAEVRHFPADQSEHATAWLKQALPSDQQPG